MMAQENRKTVGGPAIRFALLSGLVIFGFACSRQEEFDTLFREKLAKRALACFHPLGDVTSAGPIELAGEGFRATIYWKGGLSGNAYETRVETKVGTEVATIQLLADSAPIPAAETTCIVPLQEEAVPAHGDEPPTTDETGEAPAESSGLPDEAPPPP